MNFCGVFLRSEQAAQVGAAVEVAKSLGRCILQNLLQRNIRGQTTVFWSVP